MDLRKIR